MALELPSSFSLRSHHTHKLLALIEEEGEVHGFIKSSAEDVNPLTVFEVEKAKKGDGLVHLQSSFSKKYLRRSDQNTWWIAAAADGPEEDQSKWSCTLFKPNFVGGDGKTIQLTHVQLGRYVRPWNMYEPYELCLFAAERGADKEKQDVFTIVVPGSTESGDGDDKNDEFGFPASKSDGGDDKNVEFRFDNALAKIYGQGTVKLATGVANNVADTEQVMSVLLDYDINESESRTWKSSSNSRISNIKSAIPVIINGRIELSGHVFSGPYEWGTPMETNYKSVKTSYKVVVPPNTQVTVTLKATKAFFDVPFTHKQPESTQKKEGGVFTGINLYNFIYETEQKKI